MEIQKLPDLPEEDLALVSNEKSLKCRESVDLIPALSF